MAKPATHSGDRGINDSAAFLEEESLRARLPGGDLVYPRPHFVQPDSGAHDLASDQSTHLGVSYNIATRKMKYGNFETDLEAGYY
jgi:hypothetical protein